MKPAALNRIIRCIAWIAAIAALHQATRISDDDPTGQSLGYGLAFATMAYLITVRPKCNTRRNTNRKGRKS